jgi:hypothetical protein
VNVGVKDRDTGLIGSIRGELKKPAWPFISYIAVIFGTLVGCGSAVVRGASTTAANYYTLSSE